MTIINDYQLRLMQAFGFNEADLRANYRGKMSARQERSLNLLAYIRRIVLIILALAIFVVWLGLFLMNGLSPAISAVFIGALFAGVFVVWPMMNAQEDEGEIRSHDVGDVLGTLSIEAGEAHDEGRYYAVVHAFRFPVNQMQIRLLQEGDLYHIYYSSDTKKLLSLTWEQVKPSPAVEAKPIQIAKPVVAKKDAAVNPQVTFSVPNPRLAQARATESEVTVRPLGSTAKKPAGISARNPAWAAKNLMRAFYFNEADLDANQSGKISQNQLFMLADECEKWSSYIVGALVLTAILTLVAPIIGSRADGNITMCWFGLTGVMLTIIVGVKWYQFKLDYIDKVCAVAAGEITHRHGKYYEIAMATVWFRVSAYQDYELSEPRYRIYYAPHSRKILSVESMLGT